MIAKIGQISLQDQAGRHSVDGVFPLFPVVVALVQDLMGLDGGATFVPEDGLHAGRLLQQGGKLAVEVRARALSPVHIAREAHDQTLRAAFAQQPGDLLRRLFRFPGMDHRRLPGHPAERVGDRDAGARVAIVDGHYFHMVSLPFGFHDSTL